MGGFKITANVSVARNVGELRTEHLSAVRNLVKGNKNAASAISSPNIFCYVLVAVLSLYFSNFSINFITSFSNA